MVDRLLFIPGEERTNPIQLDYWDARKVSTVGFFGGDELVD